MTWLRLMILCGLLAPAASAQLLDQYLARSKQTKDFQYEIVARERLAGGEALVVQLTSQRWRGKEWVHWLRLLRPAKVRHPDAVLLVIAGGRNGRKPPSLSDRAARYLIDVGARCGCAVAVLEQVPNQPMLGGKSEDALIALTFDRYLRSGEADWPLLFPMVASAVRAIDALDGVSRLVWKQPIGRVCLTGASKRGWTSWLTAAVDRRVVALAPMVIDTLNMTRQMPHQLVAWGKYSDSILDYTILDLPRRMRADPRGPTLVRSVDPWFYRERISQPKLLLLGTNDPYWPLDAATLYFDGLAGERLLHYVPNAGHGLESSAVPAVHRFFRLVLDGQPRPRISWRLQARDLEERLTVLPSAPVSAAVLWTAEAGTRDFRTARWSGRPLGANDFGAYIGRLERPLAGYRAMFIELSHPTRGGPLSVSSRIVIVGPRK